MRPAPRMYPAQLWLFPEDANDFPKELRDPGMVWDNKVYTSSDAPW